MKAEVMGDVRIIVVADDVQLFNIGLPAKRRRCQSAISVPMAITAPRIYLSRVFCPLPRVDTRLHVVEDDLHKKYFRFEYRRGPYSVFGCSRRLRRTDACSEG